MSANMVQGSDGRWYNVAGLGEEKKQEGLADGEGEGLRGSVGDGWPIAAAEELASVAQVPASRARRDSDAAAAAQAAQQELMRSIKNLERFGKVFPSAWACVGCVLRGECRCCEREAGGSCNHYGTWLVCVCVCVYTQLLLLPRVWLCAR